MDNETNHDVQARLVALEERVAWYESEREALDEVVRELYDRVEALTTRIASMSSESATTETP